MSMDTPKVCCRGRDTPGPEHQPGHTGHGSTPRVASPGLEGPRKPVARTGPVHIFVLGHLLPPLNLSSPPLCLSLSVSPVTCARSLARSLTDRAPHPPHYVFVQHPHRLTPDVTLQEDSKRPAPPLSSRPDLWWFPGKPYFHPNSIVPAVWYHAPPPPRHILHRPKPSVTQTTRAPRHSTSLSPTEKKFNFIL